MAIIAFYQQEEALYKAMRDIFVIIRHGENVDEETNTISKKGNYVSFMEFSKCFEILID